MKKHIILLMVVFSLSATAQNIIVNGSNVNVSQDVSFPYWLDSMANCSYWDVGVVLPIRNF